jgi:glycosyltransferase involved in cell wall biosynthesis
MEATCTSKYTEKINQDSNMKILLVIDSLGSGGAQRQLVNLGIGFKEAGHEVCFLTYHPYNFFKEILEAVNIPVVTIVEPSYFKRFLKIRKFIRSHKPNSILSFLDGSNFMCEISGFPLKKWKLIVGERSANPKIRKSLKLIIYKWFHLLADHIVANSHKNIELIRSVSPFISKSKTAVIYNIVDLNVWKPSSVNLLQNNQFKLVIAASHQNIKNLNNLVEAVYLLSDQEKGKIQIDWYGDKRDDSLEKAILKIQEYALNNNFTFYPATLEIIKKFQEADAIGLFSFYEGLPNAVCEGMGSGKTIICTNVSDVSFFFQGQDDLICEAGDIQSITNALKNLLNLSDSELIEIGNKNLETAKIFFNKENIIDAYLKLMKK